MKQATASAPSAQPVLTEQATGFIAIVDCNSFYCSCERLFRPDLAKKPVVVLSNNDGCIVSRTDEAKQLGIPMAGAYFMAQNLIEQNGVEVFSSNYTLYGDLSQRVMTTLRQLAGTRQVEVYSVDEAFVHLPPMPEGEVHAYAMHMRQTVEQWTGISVSIGVSSTKTLAKAANYIAKKNKEQSGCVTCLITQQQQYEALRGIRVTHLWGVGGAYADKLINMGITSAWELRNMSPEWAYKQMGGVVGARLIRELRGERSIEMKDPLTVKKMIASTRMFGTPVNDINAIKEAIATYTSLAAQKLRRQQCSARTISIFIVAKGENHAADFSRGTTAQVQSTLPYATSVTNELIKPAVQLVERLYQHGVYYKKAGVLLSGLEPDTSIQGNLFVPEIQNRGRYLMGMMDNINFSMRDDVLKFAASGTSRNWKMRQELRSPRYTTRWAELYKVK